MKTPVAEPMTEKLYIRESNDRAHAIAERALKTIVTADACGIIGTGHSARTSIFGRDWDPMVGQNAMVLRPSPIAEKHDVLSSAYLPSSCCRAFDIGHNGVELRKMGITLPTDQHGGKTSRTGLPFCIGKSRDVATPRRFERYDLIGAFEIRIAHDIEILKLLNSSAFRDTETGSHMCRTGWFSGLLAAAAGWSSDQVDLLRLAAPMHDIGKIAIPDAILRKPGRFTAAESAVMQTHSLLGALMLSGSTSPLLTLGCRIALYHHERWDGNGYPQHLARHDIPEAARIVAIVDAYDALTHDRVYRRALSDKCALQTMAAARGTHFDPHLLDLFMHVLRTCAPSRKPIQTS